MSVHKVYLDCDGVYADFLTGILAALDYPYEGIDKWPWGRIFDIFPLIDTDWAKASKLCDAAFWENLPWTTDGRDIREEVFNRFMPTETMLLTKPMDNDESYTGKAHWVSEHMPELRRRLVTTHIPKSEFAHDRNCLLIDDNQNNIDCFVAAGGAGILVPRPWNQNDGIFFDGGAVSYVAEQMDKWIDLVNHPAKYRKGITV